MPAGRTRASRQPVQAAQRKQAQGAQQQQGPAARPPVFQLKAGEGEAPPDPAQFRVLLKQFEEAERGMWSDYGTDQAGSLASIARQMVAVMDPEQARTYGKQLYNALATTDPAGAAAALAKFRAALSSMGQATGLSEMGWGDIRHPDLLYGSAVAEFGKGNLANATNLLVAALNIAQAQYAHFHTRIIAPQPEEDTEAFREFYRGEQHKLACTACRIYHFYLDQALAAQGDAARQQQYQREFSQIDATLELSQMVAECDCGETTPKEKPAGTQPETPKGTNTPAPRQPDGQQLQQPPKPGGKAPQPAGQDPKQPAAQPAPKADGRNYKFTYVTPKIPVVKDRPLGKYAAVDVGIGAEFQVTVTFANPDSDTQYTPAEVEITTADGKLKAKFKDEVEKKFFEACKNGEASFNIKEKGGLAIEPSSGEVNVALEADFWGGGSLAFKFNIVEWEQGKLNLAVLIAEGKLSPIGVAKLLGAQDSITPAATSAAQAVFGASKATVDSKFVAEVKLKPNYKAILQYVAEKYGPKVLERLAQLGLRGAAAAGEGIATGMAAIGAGEAIVAGGALIGVASIIAATYLSLEDKALMEKCVRDAKTAARDYRSGFLSGLGYPAGYAGDFKQFFDAGKADTDAILLSHIQRFKQVEGTREHKMAQAGKSDAEIVQALKEAFVLVYDKDTMFKAAGQFTSAGEHRSKETVIAAWKTALGWKHHVNDYGHEETIIRMKVFPKYDVHGKRMLF